jgi:hypothetical protein
VDIIIGIGAILVVWVAPVQIAKGYRMWKAVLSAKTLRDAYVRLLALDPDPPNKD